MKRVKFDKEELKDIEEMEKGSNVEPLYAIPGGKDGDGNWLDKLSVGTVFLFRRTKNNDPSFLLTEACVLNKVDRGVLLRINVHEMGQNQSAVIWVLPLEFSQAHTLVEILKVLPVEIESENE